MTLDEALVGNWLYRVQSSPIDITNGVPSALGVDREDVCTEPNEADPQPTYLWADEAGMGVLCGDSSVLAGERNISWAANIAGVLKAQSPTAGEPWARKTLSRSDWKH